VKNLVLIGGGHTHAIALRMFGMKPLPGVSLSLISEASDSMYSGMLPGHVAGFYSQEACHINLSSLADFAGAEFLIDRAIGLDLKTRQVICAHHPAIDFDLVSIDIGSTPELPDLPGILDYVIPAKPVRNFLNHWNRILQHVTAHPEQSLRLAIVGGGAGGVELALNMQHRLHALFIAAQHPLTNLELHLFHRGSRLLPHQGQWVSDRLHKLMTERGIHLHLHQTVVEVGSGWLRCQTGFELACDEIIWVTHATAAPWLKQSGLSVDRNGFICVNDALQSISHPEVFAAGDVATLVHHPLPKAGVFAVRQGKPLFDNLCRMLQGQPLKPFHPPKRYLSLIGTGDRQAIAAWGNWGWQSPYLWTLKDWIDRRFMDRLNISTQGNPADGKQTSQDTYGTAKSQQNQR
jgi:selenide,water dikinase